MNSQKMPEQQAERRQPDNKECPLEGGTRQGSPWQGQVGAALSSSGVKVQTLYTEVRMRDQCVCDLRVETRGGWDIVAHLFTRLDN